MNTLELARKAKESCATLQGLDESTRIQALNQVSKALMENEQAILIANEKDLADAKTNGLGSAMIDRLTLSSKSIQALSRMCLEVAAQKQVVGLITQSHTRPDGLVIEKQRIPLGVIGMIFESRPNVVVDGAVLAIKSGNAIILKGGKEARHSNRILFDTIQQSIQGLLPEGAVNLIESREEVSELLKLDQYIDLMVPRGGSALVQFVKAHATMPVVAHDQGLCHLYVHSDCEVDAVKVVLNAKTQRPGVCNALETLILHEGYPRGGEIISALKTAGVEVKDPASELDFSTEWLDKKISIKWVRDHHEAIAHIRRFTSHHTESILAKNPKVIEDFLNGLDSSCIAINASTRFNDGGELGLGAELGISTSKLHAYGPMGTEEMTTTRFIVRGQGHVRS